jgi:hypothetical protein
MNLLILGTQIGLAFIATIGIYLLFALFDYEGGFDNLVGMVLFQPLFAVTLSAITIGCCLIVGLPIRLIKSFHQWWTNHFFLPVILTVIGLILLGLSLLTQFAEQKTLMIEGQHIIKHVPNLYLAVTGWFLTAFSILHTYPPSLLRAKVQRMVTI